MITKYDQFCFICGKPADAGCHHLIFGRGLHELADEDNLTAPICNTCHVLGKYRLHDNPTSEKLSKIIGQEYYISQWLIKEYNLPSDARDKAIEAFRKRYSKSFI